MPIRLHFFIEERLLKCMYSLFRPVLGLNSGANSPVSVGVGVRFCVA